MWDVSLNRSIKFVWFRSRDSGGVGTDNIEIGHTTMILTLRSDTYEHG